MSSMKCACSVLSSAACPALQYFSTLYHKRHDFRKTLLNIINVFWFYLQCFSETFLIIRRSEPDMVQVYIRVNVKFPLFLSRFNETWIFAGDFRKILKYKILWISIQWVPSCSMRTDGQTNRHTVRHHEANSRFSKFCESAWRRN
jgi:hypothetical protein